MQDRKTWISLKVYEREPLYIENATIKRIEYIYQSGILKISRYEFFSPFQPEREFKVYKSCKCLQILIQYVPQTIHFNFEFFKALKLTLLNEFGE